MGFSYIIGEFLHVPRPAVLELPSCSLKPHCYGERPLPSGAICSGQDSDELLSKLLAIEGASNWGKGKHISHRLHDFSEDPAARVPELLMHMAL